jgi:hypothetical protein
MLGGRIMDNFYKEHKEFIAFKKKLSELGQDGLILEFTYYVWI